MLASQSVCALYQKDVLSPLCQEQLMLIWIKSPFIPVKVPLVPVDSTKSVRAIKTNQMFSLCLLRNIWMTNERWGCLRTWDKWTHLGRWHTNLLKILRKLRYLEERDRWGSQIEEQIPYSESLKGFVNLAQHSKENNLKTAWLWIPAWGENQGQWRVI